MRVHSLNCISSCPLGGRAVDDRSNAWRGRLVNHCLLVETQRQLVLIDTGFGLRDVAAPRTRLSRFFLALNAPDFREEMTAIRQIERLGFDPRDVRHIVLTHLDSDHAGGLDDFPWAAVHMLAAERDSARAQRTPLDRMRYRPQQWGLTAANWRVYQAGEGEPWLGFDCVRELDEVPPEIVLVPLIGHTLGHAGVAVDIGAPEWILLAGDAYFFAGEMDLRRPRCTPGLRGYQRLMEKDRRARLWNQKRLRQLKLQHGAEVLIFSSHDAYEFEIVSGRKAYAPAEPLVPRPVMPATIEEKWDASVSTSPRETTDDL